MFFVIRFLQFYLIPLLVVIHVIRTGRNTTWIWIIFIGSYVGVAAYFIIEIWPEWMRGRAMRRAKSVLRDVVDPARDLRDAHKNLRINDSVESRRKFADELLSRGRYDDAIEQYRAGMTGIYEHEPLLLFGVARAQFAKNMFAESRQTMDDLATHNPDFKSADYQLLYARALEAEGNTAKALRQYEIATRSFVGTEAMYRYGSLLKRTGEIERGNQTLREVLHKAEISNSAFRREQRPWIEAAKRELS